MTPSAKRLSPTLLSRIADAITSIRYGAVHITIHDSQVVQIEHTEKIRFLQDADLTSGGDPRCLSLADQTAGGARPLAGGSDG